MTEWQNRIIGEGEENPEQLLANPENWRIHPKQQQDVLTDVLDEVGWVQRVIVNRTTGHMVDGHLRAQLAISRGEPSIPVTYVELTVEEERKILATLDPIAALAVRDHEKLDELIGSIEAEGEALSKWLDDQTARQNPDGEWQGMPPFSSEDLEAPFRTTVNFATEADRDEFFRSIDRPRRRSFWWPSDDGHVGSDTTSAEWASGD